MSLSVNTKIIAKSEPYSCELEGEAIVLEPMSRHYFGLNEVASFVWNLIQSEVRVSEVVEKVCSNFEVDSDTCLSDVLLFLNELTEKNLLQVLPDA